MQMIPPCIKNNVTVTGNPAARKTLLFVHGFGTDQRDWKAVIAPYLADFRIVLLDNVGAGGSAPEAFVQHRYLNLNTYASDLLDVCQALGLQEVIAVGHSVGAMICVLAALKKPAVFSRLVLIAASPRYLNEEGYHGGFDKKDLDALYDAVSQDYERWVEMFAPLAMSNPGRPRLAEHFAATLKTIPAQQAFTVLCSIFQGDHRAEVRALNKPVLLIQSRDDIAVPQEVGEYLHTAIRGSVLKVIDASGHLPHVSAPQAVIDAMDAFVREA